MQRSKSIKALAKALVLAKSKMEAPHKNKTNPHFKSKYADLAGVKESYQAPIAEQGLSFVNALALKDTVLTLTTTLLHAESTEWMASDFPIPAGLKAQEIGSALTYGRRYNVCALLDIVAEDDDDGNAATPAKAPEKKPEPAPIPVKASVLSREEIESMHSLAKAKGLNTVTAFREYLKGLTKQEQAKDLSKAEYVSVMEALKAQKVPA